jgi:hypothetical protein
VILPDGDHAGGALLERQGVGDAVDQEDLLRPGRNAYAAVANARMTSTATTGPVSSPTCERVTKIAALAAGSTMATMCGVSRRW